MQLVVEISEDTFFDLKKKQNRTEVDNAVLNGTPLPHGNGKWIKRQYINGSKSINMIFCTNCGEEFSYDAETGIGIDDYNYCPKCGAYMRHKTKGEE